MEIELKDGIRFKVDINDGRLTVYPTPMGVEQLAEIKLVAIKMYRSKLAELEGGSHSEEDLIRNLVAISVNNFFSIINKTPFNQRDDRADFSPYSFVITYYSTGNPEIELFCRKKVGENEYTDVLTESLSMYPTYLGYDVGGPMEWLVKHITYRDKKPECIYSTFGNDSDIVNGIRNFINSYCIIPSHL